MAFMSQEKKAQLAPAIKAICKKYGVSASLAVNNHSTLVLNIKSGPLNFIGNSNRVCSESHYQIARGFTENKNQYMQVNEYWLHEHFDGDCLKFLTEVKAAMNVGNHDRSDSQRDHFDIGWYVNINVGKWNKPYIVS